MIIGYARVSTTDQNLDAQTDALTAVGAERLFSERVSGAKAERPELDKMLDQLRDGDVVVVICAKFLSTDFRHPNTIYRASISQ
jgi:DNA invertase Pin-like site-specific DNA recombinase